MKAERRDIEFNSLDEALQILDRAAQRSGTEVRNMISNDYKHLKEALSEIGPEVKGALRTVGREAEAAIESAGKNVSTFVRSTAKQVDKGAHEYAWWYVTAAALVGVAIGYFLASKSTVSYAETNS